MSAYETTHPYWTGRFAMTIALAQKEIGRSPVRAAEDLRRTLDEFLRSPVPSEELRDGIRKEIAR